MIARGTPAPAEALEALRRGEPVSHVAKRHGCSAKLARRWAYDYGISVRRGRPLAPLTRDEACAAMREHVSCAAAAKALGYAWLTVAKRVRGW